MSDKKCPLNNFEPCIGKDCAFFVEPIQKKPSAGIKSAFGSDDKFIIDPIDISFPCSIAIMGKIAFLSKQPNAKKMKK